MLSKLYEKKDSDQLTRSYGIRSLMGDPHLYEDEIVSVLMNEI